RTNLDKADIDRIRSLSDVAWSHAWHAAFYTTRRYPPCSIHRCARLLFHGWPTRLPGTVMSCLAHFLKRDLNGEESGSRCFRCCSTCVAGMVEPAPVLGGSLCPIRHGIRQFALDASEPGRQRRPDGSADDQDSQHHVQKGNTASGTHADHASDGRGQGAAVRQHGLEDVVGERSRQQVGKRGSDASNHPAYGEDPPLYVGCHLTLPDGLRAGVDDRYREQENKRGRDDENDVGLKSR